MHAVILAGGEGRRLRPYTTVIPKPLVPIGDDTSVLDVVLQQLAARHFRTVTLAIGSHGHLIRSFVGDGSRWGLTVTYAEEAVPLGTIGPLLPVLNELPEHFLAMNGDVLTDLDLAALLRRHMRSGAPLTVATCARQTHIDFGVVTSSAGIITDFREKPSMSHEVSMGVYALSRSTLTCYEAGQPLGFDTLLLDLLAREDRPATFPWDGYWLDIGRPEDYERATREFDDVRSVLVPRESDSAAVAGQPGVHTQLPSGPILVVGGTGFLGQHIVKACAEKMGRPILVVSRTVADQDDGAIRMDLARAGSEEIVALLRKTQPAAVINCAGTTTGSADDLLASNVTLTANLVDALGRVNADIRLVHIGSAAEYGSARMGTSLAESTSPRPASLYGTTKLAASTIVLDAVDNRQLDAVVLRVFNPIGPGSPPTSLAGRVAAELRIAKQSGEPVRIGTLRGFRDFVDVRDVAHAVALALPARGVTGVFNVGRGSATAIRHLVSDLARIAGYDGSVRIEGTESTTSAGVEWQCANISHATATLGWVPHRELADSLRDLWADAADVTNIGWTGEARSRHHPAGFTNRPAPMTTECSRHDEVSDHQRPPVHQRDQAPG